MNALYKGVIVSGVVSAVAFWFITQSLMPGQFMTLFGCTLIGLALTAAMIVDHRVLHRHRILARCARSPRPRRPATRPT
jgi:Na+/H+-translocating membrane pyrophosphatase